MRWKQLTRLELCKNEARLITLLHMTPCVPQGKECRPQIGFSLIKGIYHGHTEKLGEYFSMWKDKL